MYSQYTDKLDRQASDIRAFVTTTIEKQILDSTSENSIYHAHDLSCIATAQALGESLKHAIVHGLWPLHELPGDLETCIARVERTPDREYSFGPCRSTHCDVNDSNFYWMRHRVKDARKKIVGLCLDCERYNGLPQGIPCRVNHD